MPLPLGEDTVRSLHARRGPSPHRAGTLILDFRPPKLRNQFLVSISHPGCGILLQQPEQTKAASWGSSGPLLLCSGRGMRCSSRTDLLLGLCRGGVGLLGHRGGPFFCTFPRVIWLTPPGGDVIRPLTVADLVVPLPPCPDPPGQTSVL